MFTQLATESSPQSEAESVSPPLESGLGHRTGIGQWTVTNAMQAEAWKACVPQGSPFLAAPGALSM